MPLLPVALLAGGGGLTDIDATLFASTLVLFALFAWVLKKFAWGPLLGIIEEREKSIREAVEGSEKANAEAKDLLEKHRAMLREATDGVEFPDTVEAGIATEMAVREVEVQIGFSASNADFLAACAGASAG